MSRKRPRSNKVENAMVRSIDALAQFDEYASEVLPILRKAIAEGWSAEQIEKHPKVKAALVARQLSIALKDPNASTALSAIKDARDRLDGKATENKNIHMSLDSASDDELDAKLKELMGNEEEVVSEYEN